MPQLPTVSASEAIAAFERLGRVYRRFRSGHHVMVKPGQYVHFSIPDHHEIKDGTLRKLIRSAGIEVRNLALCYEADRLDFGCDFFQEAAMRICLCSVFVDDQAKALQFYTEKLGFILSKDKPMGADRWLTVVAPGDAAGTELLLEPMGIPEAKTYQQTLYAKGIPATSFESADIQADYERLSALGVKFSSPPSQQPWGWSATFDDTCGNWIHLHQV